MIDIDELGKLGFTYVGSSIISDKWEHPDLKNDQLWCYPGGQMSEDYQTDYGRSILKSLIDQCDPANYITNIEGVRAILQSLSS